MRKVTALPLLIGMWAAPDCSARIRPSHGSRNTFRTSTTQQRRRFHIDPYLTEPGNVDLELGTALSSAYRSSPVTIKHTPDGLGDFGRRTEFSASFESVSSAAGDDSWTTHFGDRIGIQANHMLYDAAPLSIVFAPPATFLLRNGEGARLGGTMIGNYDFGLHSIGSHVTWTGATASSASNPPRDLEAGGGYVRRLGKAGNWNRWTLFVSAAREMPSGQAHVDTVVEGAIPMDGPRRTGLCRAPLQG